MKKLDPKFDDSIFEKNGAGELTPEEIKSHVNELLDKSKQGQSICAANVEEKPLRWLWPGRIPSSKSTLIAGDPDKGKSTLCLDLAARVSTGSPWPDGKLNDQGTVLILTAEDDLADTAIPRLRAAGADLSNVLFLQTVKKYNPETEEEIETIPSLVDDLADIEQEISVYKPRLVIIDPLNAYLPGVDTHRDAEMRSRVFAPVKRLLEGSEAAFVYIMHLNKSTSQNAAHRVLGSISNYAAARASWLVVDDKDSDDKLFLHHKHNLTEKQPGLKFKIVSNPEGLPVIAWSKDTIDMSADEALRPDTSTAPEREAAEEFLMGMLENGSVPACDIYSEAEAFSLSNATLRRAKKKLKITAYRTGTEGVQGGGKWWWELPKKC